MAQQATHLSLITWLKSKSEDALHSKSLKPYHLAARWIPIAVGPFININASLYAGAAKLNNSELPYVGLTVYRGHEVEQEHDSAGTGEEDVSNFDKINAVCPGLKEVLKAFNGDENLLKCFANHLSTAANGARADDANSCRKATPTYILPSHSTDEEVMEKKSNRGWNNPYTARLLCPLKHLQEFDRDPQLFMDKVLDGTLKIKTSLWPSFLYPDDTVYNPECIDEGLFRGSLMIQFLRNICTGPTSAFDGVRRSGKPSKAEIHGMDHVFGRCVAYVAVQAYFSLSSIEQWSTSPQDGYFALDDFFDRCVDLFESDPDDPWVTETLSVLTSELPSLKRENKRKHKRRLSLTLDEASDDDEAKAIYAQRKARRLEHIVKKAETNGGPEKIDSSSNGIVSTLSSSTSTCSGDALASGPHAGPAYDTFVNQTLSRPSTPSSSSSSLSSLRSPAPKLATKNKKIPATSQPAKTRICTPRRTRAATRAVAQPAKYAFAPAKDAPESSELSGIDE